MRKHLQLWLWIAVLLPLTASFLEARERPYPVEVTVTDTDKNPLEGAGVRWTGTAGDPFTVVGRTDARGKFRQELPDRTRSYRIALAKEGYLPFESEVNLGGIELKRGATLLLSYELAPRNAQVIFNEGVAALQNRDTRTALARFEEALSKKPDFLEALRAIYTIHLVEKRPAEALVAADRLLGIASDNVDALRARYEALDQLGRREEALETLERLIPLDPSTETARICYNVGAAAWNEKEAPRARKWFERALSLDPKLYQAHVALAEMAIAEQKYAEALASLDRVLELTPRNFRVHERKIELLRAMGRTEDAEAASRKLEELRRGS